MTTLYCAICAQRFEPDDDHVKINAEHVRMDDRNREELFVFCPECWDQHTEDWMEPA